MKLKSDSAVYGSALPWLVNGRWSHRSGAYRGQQPRSITEAGGAGRWGWYGGLGCHSSRAMGLRWLFMEALRIVASFEAYFSRAD